MANNEQPLNRASIDRLCALADLPLTAARRDALVAPLAGLMAAANELSRKMAEGSRRGMLPITRFPDR